MNKFAPVSCAWIVAMALLAFGEEEAFAQADLGSFSGTKCRFYTQTTSAGAVANTSGGFTFYSNLTNGTTGSILSSSTLTTPAGGAGTFGYSPNSQISGQQYQAFFDTQVALDAAFPDGAAGATGTGAYQLTINTSTPNTYAEQFTFGPDNYPAAIPQITNGTWSNGNFIIADPTQPVTITFPSFVGTNEGGGGGIGVFIGSNFSQIIAADGTHNQCVIPANTLSNNAYYTGSIQYTNNGAGTSSPTSFQEQVNFTVQVGTPPDVSSYGVQKEENYDQSSSAAPTLDPRTPFQFSSNVSTQGGASVLLSSSSVTAPGGTANFYDSGTNGLYFQQRFISKSALDTAFPTGTYNFAINTSTPNAYAAQATLGADNYPPVPQIIGLTNATWSGGSILVTDITKPVTVTWQSFNSSNGMISFGVNNLNVGTNFNADGTTDSYTFTPGTANALSNNQTYETYLDFSNNTGGSSSAIAGATTGAGYQTQLQFIIQTGTGSTSNDGTNIPLLYKGNVLLQTSNSAPVNAPVNTSQQNDSTPPFGFNAQNAVGGVVTGPGATSPYALGFDGGTDGAHYRYSSGSVTSLTALNATYPDGTYTVKDTLGNTLASLSLTGDVYPNVPKILAVNGLTPTWNGQGQLVLDPSIDNIITWSPFTTTNANFTPLTGGHESVDFDAENSNDNVNIELETGAIKSSGQISSPFSSMLVPANSMTTGNTYDGNIQYFLSSGATFVSGAATSAAGYITENAFIAVASAPATAATVYLADKFHVVQQTSNSAPADAPLGSTPVTAPAPYSFRAQGPAAGTETGPAPGGSNVLTFNASNNAYRFSSPAEASLAASNAAYPDGTYVLSDGNNVALSGDVYPNVPQLIEVNGAPPVWNSSGQLALDPTIENTLTWTAFTTTNGTFTAATGGDEHFKLIGNQDGVTFDQRAGVTESSTTLFNSVVIPPNSLTVGNTYPVAIDYYLATQLNTVSAGIFDTGGYETDNYFTIAPALSSSGANTVVKTLSYAQTTAAAPTTGASPYQFTASGPVGASVGGVAGAGVPGPYALGATGTYTGATFATLTSFNAAYPSGFYSFADGTSINFAGDAYPVAPQVTLVNGVAPIWSNGQLVLNPAIDNTLTWTAYPGSFAAGEENLAVNGVQDAVRIAQTAFGPGSGTISTIAFNAYTIPAGTLKSGNTYQSQIAYFADGVTRQGSGDYDLTKYESVNSFTILGSSEYSAEKEHVLQQTSNNAPVDYAGPSYDPGPYNFKTFGTAGSTVGPAGSSTLTFSANDDDFEFRSPGFATLPGLNATYPDGNYTLTNAVQVALTGDVFPNIVQVTAVNGAPPIWNGAGQLQLNPAIANTITWTPFTASNGSFNYATGGVEHITINGNQDSIDIDQQSAGPAGTAAFNTLTIPANTITSGNTYTGSFDYQLASAGVFTPTTSIAVYLTNTYVTILGTGTTAQPLAAFNGSGISNQVVGNVPITLSTSSISGNQITYTVSGPATLGGAAQNVLTLTGPGVVTVTASVLGDATYAPGTLSQSFTVSAAPPVQQFNSLTILHHFGDGSLAGDGTSPSGSLIQASNGFLYGTTTGGGANANGTVFGINSLGQSAILHSFGAGATPADGSAPQGLIQGSDGNFYGVTNTGGAFGQGTIFMLTPSGQLTTWHTFGDGSVSGDGAGPCDQLLLASDGNFYGVTAGGGSAGGGTFFQMTPARHITILHNFNTAAVDGRQPFDRVIQGADGAFYGLTGFGGTAGSGVVYRITSSGQFSVLHSFEDGSVSGDGGQAIGALVQGADGNFYGNTAGGGIATGAAGAGTIFKITPQGNVTILHRFGDGSVPNDGQNPWPVTQGSDGNFYGVTQNGGANQTTLAGQSFPGEGAIFKMTPQGVVSLLHSFNDGSVVADGQLPLTELVQAPNGTFYGITASGGSAGEGTIFNLKLGVAELTSATTATGTATLPFTYQTTTSTPTTGFSATNLPAGLSINAQTGLISGTPTTPGTTTATLTLTGAAGTNTAQVTITIVPLPVPVVSSILYAFGSINTAFDYTTTATNNATSYSATGLTGTGLSISSTTGEITGTPTAVGTISAAITATNVTGPGLPMTVKIQIFATAPTLSQEYVVLHRFNDGSVTTTGININSNGTVSDGQNPFSIFQAFDGTFYGTANHGGNYNDGVVFNMTVQGTTSIVANFSTGGGSAPLPVVAQGAVQGADGNFYIASEFGGDSTSSGNFVEANPVTGAHSVLHNFGDGTVPGDGLNPQGQSVQGRDGYFYGVTLNGGTANAGTVYKINTLGIETVLHSFGAGVTNDGLHPVSALIQGADGNFYGTTPGGGASGQGTIYEITPQGVVTILHSFGSVANDGTYPAAALVQGVDGYFYGTTQYGGTSGTGTVFQLTSQGLNILHSFNNGSVTNDGSNPSAPLIQGVDGNFYGTTQNGGAAAFGTIFVISSAGQVAIIHSFGDGTVPNDGANPAGSVYEDTDGNFYGTTLNGGAGSGYGTAFVIVANQLTTHVPVFVGATYATGSINAPFSYTPKALFGVLASGDSSNLVTPNVVEFSPNIIKPATSATSWTISGTSNPLLPSALSFNTTSGAITGTPLTAGVYTVTITPKNSIGSGTPETVTLYIDVPPMITSAATAGGAAGTLFSYQITGNAAPSSFGAIGLPSWLAVNTTTGMITGTPPGGGTYSFTPTATNYAGTGSEQVVLSVTGNAANAPSLTSATRASGTAGTPFTYTIAASNTPTSFSALLLPVGLVFDPTTGIISGTPTTAGTYSVPIGASNNNGPTAGELTITIVAANVPLISTPLTASCNIGNAFTYQIPATGLIGIFNATNLPRGLSVNVVSGLISGTPSNPGTTPIILTAANSTGTASATLNLTVAAIPISYSTWYTTYPTLTGGTTGTPLNDGTPNLLKYLVHIDPTVSMSATDRAALPTVGKDTTSTPGTTYLTLTFREWASASTSPIIETSPDMQTWTTVTPDISQQIGTDATTGDPIMEMGVNVTGVARKFIRLTVPSP